MSRIKRALKLILGYNEDPEKYAEEISEKLIKFVIKSALRVFKDGEFRRNFNFAILKGKETDRLYNELSITAIVLLMLTLDDVAQRKGEEVYFWREVREKIPQVFKNWLLKLGLTNNIASTWIKAIDSRYEEYQGHQREYRHIMEEKNKYFAKIKNEAAKDSYVRFQTVALGSFPHIKKERYRNYKPSIKYLKNWLAVLNKQIESRI